MSTDPISHYYLPTAIIVASLIISGSVIYSYQRDTETHNKKVDTNKLSEAVEVEDTSLPYTPIYYISCDRTLNNPTCGIPRASGVPVSKMTCLWQYTAGTGLFSYVEITNEWVDVPISPLASPVSVYCLDDVGAFYYGEEGWQRPQ